MTESTTSGEIPQPSIISDLWVKALVDGPNAQPLYIGTDRASGRLMVTSDVNTVEPGQIKRLQGDLTGQQLVRDFTGIGLNLILPVKLSCLN